MVLWMADSIACVTIANCQQLTLDRSPTSGPDTCVGGGGGIINFENPFGWSVLLSKKIISSEIFSSRNFTIYKTGKLIISANSGSFVGGVPHFAEAPGGTASILSSFIHPCLDGLRAFHPRYTREDRPTITTGFDFDSWQNFDQSLKLRKVHQTAVVAIQNENESYPETMIVFNDCYIAMLSTGVI